MVLVTKKAFTVSLILFGLITLIHESYEARGGGSRSSSSRSSSSRSSSSSSSSRSSSSSSRSGSSSSRASPSISKPSSSSSSNRGSSFGSQQSSGSNSWPKPSSTNRGSNPSSGPQNTPVRPPNFGSPAKPFTPKPNTFNSNGNLPTPRSNVGWQQGQQGQPFAQPFTPKPNSFNPNSNWPTPRSNVGWQQGQPQAPNWQTNGQYPGQGSRPFAQPFTPKPNSFNPNGNFPTPRSNVGWQQGQPQPPNWQTNGQYPGQVNQPKPPYWSSNSNTQQASPWQNNGVGNGFNQPQQTAWSHNSYPQQQRPAWSQSWNSNPTQTWHQQAPAPIIINNVQPMGGSSSSSFMQKFQMAANMMTMYNFYQNIKSPRSHNSYYGPGPNYNGQGQYYGQGQNYGQGSNFGQGQYNVHQQYHNQPQGPNNNQGYDGWHEPPKGPGPGGNNETFDSKVNTVPSNDNATHYSHYWFPQPTNFYSDFYNFSDSDVSAYDASSDGCCNGKVFSMKTTRKRNCCGAKDYDPSFYVCCGDKTHMKRSEFTCCGNEYYNYEESLCCFRPFEGPVVVRLPFDIRVNSARKQQTSCCGDELFNMETHVCCGSQTANSYTFISFPRMYGNESRCCYDRLINGSATVCENSPPPHLTNKDDSDSRALPKQLGVCANELYNAHEKICCTTYNYTNQVYSQFLANKSSEATACCADSTYDTKTELCCSGVVLGNATGKECCGESLYNVSTHWCCVGTNLTVLSSSSGGEDGCCGESKKAYSSKKQMCCGNSVVDIPDIKTFFRYGCCTPSDKSTAKTFDRYQEVCCDGVVHKINGTYQQKCCGKTLMNAGASFCCSNKVIARTKNSACCNETSAYDSSTHMCCNSKTIAKKSPQQTSCCGSLLFADSSEICCYNPMTDVAAVEPRKNQWMQCCDTKPFDPETQTCCDDEVVDNNGTSLCCMQFDPLIPRMNFAVLKKSSSKEVNDFCCGLKVYNAETEVCCNLTVIATKGYKDARCCGSVMYRSEKELCCNGVVQQKKFIDSACCGDKVFNVNHDICCGNVIKWKGATKNPTCCVPGMEDI